MIKTILLITVYVLISALEVIPLYKEHKLKEIILYSSILSLSLIVNVMLLHGFNFISLAKLINIILRLD